MDRSNKKSVYMSLMYTYASLFLLAPAYLIAIIPLTQYFGATEIIPLNKPITIITMTILISAVVLVCLLLKEKGCNMKILVCVYTPLNILAVTQIVFLYKDVALLTATNM